MLSLFTLKVNQNYLLRFIGIAIGILNVITINNRATAMIIVLLQLLVIVYLLIKRKYTDYIGCYCIFYSLCVEFGTFTNTESFYNLKNTRILGVNLGIWLLLPISIMGILNAKVILFKRNNNLMFKFAKTLLCLMLIAIIMGLITIALNDNGILSLPNLLHAYVNEIYTSFGVTIMIIFTILYIYTFNNLDLIKLQNYLLSVIYGTIAQVFTSSILGIHGHYGGVNTLLACTLSFMMPLFPIILFYYFLKRKTDTQVGIIGIAASLYCLYITLINNANGKMIILSILCPIFFYNILRRRYGKICYLLLPLLPMLLLCVIQLLHSSSANSILLTSKLNQVITLFNVTSSSWFDFMRSSPRFRVAEFISIAIEYIDKPGYMLLGKGVLGTIIDHTNSFGSSFLPGTFSEEEWSIGAFYSMHFVVASFLLWNGILGLWFYISTIVKNIHFFSKSIFLFVGTVWFAVYYGYSATMTVFGILALLLGYLEIEEKYYGK